MSWWKRRATEPEAVNTDLPLVRLEGITRHFVGDADETTVALQDVTLDIDR